MKVLIICLTILSTPHLWAESTAEVFSSEDAKMSAAESVVVAQCTPFAYPKELSDAQIYKKTLGNLSDETILREVRRHSDGRFTLAKMSSDVNVGLHTTAQGCKELLSFVMVIGQRYSDGCAESYMVTVRDQNISANVGKLEVKTLISCPRSQNQDQAHSISNY